MIANKFDPGETVWVKAKVKKVILTADETLIYEVAPLQGGVITIDVHEEDMMKAENV